MISKKYKPLLLNDLIELFIQQKYNYDENKHFCINYFIGKDLVNDVDINYFNGIFEEVHLTKQEDENFSLELFNLKESVLVQFDFYYQNNLLDDAYTHIIANFPNPSPTKTKTGDFILFNCFVMLKQLKCLMIILMNMKKL